MRAVRCETFAVPSNLRWRECALRCWGSDESLVEIRLWSTRLNVANVGGMIDRTTLCRTPGRDFAGVVVGESPARVGVEA